jgi:hypothetical protein
MNRIQPDQLLLGSLVMLGSLGLSAPVAAQVIYPVLPQQQTAPIQPKLSPYLDLLRNDDSVLNPYHSFVLPRREIHRQQARQAAEINHLKQGTSRRGAHLADPANSPRLPTGGGGRFQTYLHFYRMNSHP